MSDRNRSANDLARLSLAVSLMTLIGCGGGGSEEAAPAETSTTTAGKAEPKKSEIPTVKGLGATAKGRQEGIDASASGGGGAPIPPEAEAARKAMMQGQGGPPGGAGRPSEKESEPASGPGAITPGQLQTAAPSGGGGYVPPGVGGPPGQGQGPGGPPGQGSGGPGGYVPPGVASGGPGGGGPPGVGMMPPGGYGGPGGGFGGPGGGNSGPVLLAQNAFTEGGDALQAEAPKTGAAGMAGAVSDFKDPTKAVESFLSAVQSKDPELIAEAISKRAPEEAKTVVYKKILTGALAKNLKDEDLESLAEAFADYKVENIGVSKSSGSMNVTVGRTKKATEKQKRTEYERRIMRVHRDGKVGWKVIDLGNKIAF